MQIFDYSIVVVDYLGRFDDYFVPLIKSLVIIFPDKEILCVLNGHPDKTAQIEYIKKATVFLAKYPNVRYLTNENHQPLAKCWNWAILMAQTDGVLILNDDLTINPLFREDLEIGIKEAHDFFIINSSWSHFYISKKIIKSVGWFEERLAGIGWEDGDYMLRMADKKIEIVHKKCRGVRNLVAPPTNVSWGAVSGNEGKYAAVNKKFFDEKWRTWHSHGEGEYKIEVLYNGVLIKGTQVLETPLYYDFGLLSDNNVNMRSEVYLKRSSSVYKMQNWLVEIFRNIRSLLRNK